MNKVLFSFLLVVVLLAIPGAEALAQCPMCRATAETNLANGGTEGQGLNNGIMYMLMMPYVLIGVIAYLWMRNRKSTPDAPPVETYV